MSLPSFRTPALAALGCALVLGTPCVHATLLVYDPFNQAPGTLNGTSSSGGSPAAVWPTAGQNYTTPTGTTQVVSGSLSGNVVTQDNRAQVGPEASASIFRLFGATLGGAGTDLWVSFLINATSAKNSQVLSLFNGAQEDLAIGVNGSTVFGMSVRTNGATTTAGNPAVSTATAPNNATHFVAVHLQLVAGTGSSTFSFFVDPDLASYGTLAPSGGQSAVFSGNNSLPFSFDRIRLGEFSGATTAFDEIRIADNWADASPIPAPEPAAVGLLALGAGSLGVRRRRRGK